MLRMVLSLVIMCAACRVAEQPNSLMTVAAYEVPLPTPLDKRRFIALLTQKAQPFGFHVDAATDEQLELLSAVSPQTFNAAVWRGKNDEDPIASAMDFRDRLGRVWITFTLGEDPTSARQFREALIPVIQEEWPDTASLPIMPNGGIPLTEDLMRTSNGYIVKPTAAAKYANNRR